MIKGVAALSSLLLATTALAQEPARWDVAVTRASRPPVRFI